MNSASRGQAAIVEGTPACGNYASEAIPNQVDLRGSWNLSKQPVQDSHLQVDVECGIPRLVFGSEAENLGRPYLHLPLSPVHANVPQPLQYTDDIGRLVAFTPNRAAL